jgi:hypothetical protein
MFLSVLDPDPDPLVRGMDPDPDPAPDPNPSIIKQKSKKNLLFVTNNFFNTGMFFVGLLKVNDENRRLRIRILIH